MYIPALPQLVSPRPGAVVAPFLADTPETLLWFVPESMFDDDTETTKRKKSVLLKPQVATPFASVGDELLMLMQQSKLGDSQGLFARELKAAPESGVIIACDYQLQDLMGFCTHDYCLDYQPHFLLGQLWGSPHNIPSLLKSHRTDYPRVFILPAFLI